MVGGHRSSGQSVNVIKYNVSIFSHTTLLCLYSCCAESGFPGEEGTT